MALNLVLYITVCIPARASSISPSIDRKKHTNTTTAENTKNSVLKHHFMVRLTLAPLTMSRTSWFSDKNPSSSWSSTFIPESIVSSKKQMKQTTTFKANLPKHSTYLCQIWRIHWKFITNQSCKASIIPPIQYIKYFELKKHYCYIHSIIIFYKIRKREEENHHKKNNMRRWWSLLL